ncbi:MAG: Ig-like domain-containing protein [Candidatus Marinimicrobia bacterium]|nr:Ig-like domain-containing protein [Candidatus Neomarinimicrobiota bacterium]
MKKLLSTILFSFCLIGAQEKEKTEKDSLHFEFEPDSLFLHVGESSEVTIKLLNQNGELANNPFYAYGRPRRALESKPRISDSTGVAKITVKAHKPGKLSLSVRSISQKREDRVTDKMVVQVPYPPLDRIVFNDPQSKIYVGTSINYSITVYDQADLVRDSAKVTLISSNMDVADFDMYGNLNGKKPGRIIITATADDISESVKIRVVKNPVRKVTLSAETNQIRTGDVLNFTAKTLTRSGKKLNDVPVRFSYSGEAKYGIGLPPSGLITADGKFVAEIPGIYTITAQSSGYSARKIIKVEPRNVRKRVEVVGHGTISDVRTSDLWIWPGIGEHEGKDFAVTGTWSANGEAYFWDVTDPANMVIIDTVTVDARTVNDVKVSEDGTVCVITREGASNRKNGFVVLDVRDPFNVKITAAFNDDMTGGVHNVFIYDNHVYAVNNGRKYDVINIENPSNPFRVGRYELGTPGHGVHDVWVIDGLAYSSNWSDGVHVVDVGGIKFDEKNHSKIQYNPFLAKAGQGSPGNPVKLGSLNDRNGHNHAAFPFISQSTDKFYIVTGDEWGNQFGMAGGFHFLDFSDTDNPKETAVYQVPEAGSHNHWIYGDTLLASYYQGGLRIVDISGELLGDIYAQGREMAFFLSGDPNGFTSNRPNVWGTMPYKGLIYFSDMNNGLWAVKLVDDQRMGTK